MQVRIDLSKWRGVFYANQDSSQRLNTMFDLQYLTAEAFVSYYRTEIFKNLNKFEKDSVLSLQLILSQTFNAVHSDGLENQVIWDMLILEGDILDTCNDFDSYSKAQEILVDVFSAHLTDESTNGSRAHYIEKVNHIRTFYTEMLKQAYLKPIASYEEF